MAQGPNSTVIGGAVLYSGRGGYDVVSIGDRPTRAPTAGEVRIRVAAAAVSPTDILLRDPGFGDTPPPVTPGMDAAGTVEAIGEGVSRLAVGDQVMTAVLPLRAEGGAQATFLLVPAGSPVRIPKGSSFAEAATIPMNGLTALLALDYAALSAGHTLAVTGGAGWLAYQAIAIAKSRGLRVVADAKREEFDLVRDYGADIVVERGTGFAAAVRATMTEGVDALLDTALLGKSSFAAIKDGGIYLPVRGWDESASERGIRIKQVFVSEVLERTEWLEELRDLVEAGRLVPRIAGEYPMANVADAQRALLAGGIRGRPVLLF